MTGLYLIGRIELSAADATLFNCPVGHVAHVWRIVAANTSASSRTYRLHHLRPVLAETSGTSNALLYDVRLAANTTEIIGDGTGPLLTLRETETLHGLASAASAVTLSFYGQIEVGRYA